MWNPIDFSKIALGAMLLVGISSNTSLADGIDLSVTFVDGGTGIDFGDLNSLNSDGSDASDSSIGRIRLAVTNTLGLPYVITQRLTKDVENNSGEVISNDAIRFRIVEESGSGIIRTSDREPLNIFVEDIYLSDTAGTDTTLLITYELMVPAKQKAGRYFSTLSFQVETRSSS